MEASSLPARRRRRTAREKIAILVAARSLSPAQAAIAYGVSRKTILSWRANECRFRQEDQQAQLEVSYPRTSRELHNSIAFANVNASIQSTAGSTTTSTQDEIAGARREPFEEEHTAHATNAPMSLRSSASSGMLIGDLTSVGDARDTHAIGSPDTSVVNEAHNQQPSSVPRDAEYVDVGYVGRRGTLAEIAIRTMFPLLRVGSSSSSTTPIESVGFAHAVDAMNAVVDRKLDFCVLPTASLFTLQPDFMLIEVTAKPLKIAGEIVLPLDLCLCALPGTSLQECDCVMSDIALLQRFEGLILKLENDRGLSIVRQAAWDSAGACFIVRDQAAQNIAVLSSKEAARDAGLDILVGSVCGDGPENVQYLILGRHQSLPIQPRFSCAVRKATVYLHLRSQPMWISTIMEALAVVYAHVTDIQTRSVRSGEYQVLITVMATVSSPAAKIPRQLLQRFDELATSMHVFEMYFSVANLS